VFSSHLLQDPERSGTFRRQLKRPDMAELVRFALADTEFALKER